EEFSELGSGFNVAMRDLDIRGSGNLLGAEQSGFIAEIGFEMYNKILDEAVQELKDDEFGDLFADDSNRKYVSFTQIDTDLEVLIPDEYVTNISERYNLYNDIAKLKDEQELQAFEQQLTDRFGPIPALVFELFNTLRLQWLGKEIGFEKISFKKDTLKGFFVSNAKSAYYQSDQFGKVLAFVQAHANISNLKEVKGQLRLAINNVNSIEYAIDLLSAMK